jgi:hypothetical protein
MSMRRILTDPDLRFARRLVLVVLWLILIDRAVDPILRVAERARYESSKPFRFENSDLFALGPLVRYLREHPVSARPRFVFLGNSMMFGYLLPPEQAVPAQFEKRAGGIRVFNASLNGAEAGSHYLIAKSMIGAVDGFVVQVTGDKANPLLPSLIPIEAEDSRRFRLDVPNRVEQGARNALGRAWRLFAMNDRLQAAFFGTSTRQYLYLHKREIVLTLLRPIYSPPPPPPRVLSPIAALPTLRSPRGGRAEDLAKTQPVLRDFGALAKANRKRLLLIQFEYAQPLDAAGPSAFNDAYGPYAEMIMIHVPASLTYDGQHLTDPGCGAVADLLWSHEQRWRRGGAR